MGWQSGLWSGKLPYSKMYVKDKYPHKMLFLDSLRPLCWHIVGAQLIWKGWMDGYQNPEKSSTKEIYVSNFEL